MIKVVVPTSGGKDSQVTLKLALEKYPKEEVLSLFTDTKFEHPLTYSHLDRIEEMYGIKITRISAGSVEEKILKHKRFPWPRGRFCTEELKLWPSKYFYRDLAKEQGAGFEVWIGVRRQESVDRSIRYAGIVGEELLLPSSYMRKFPKYLDKAGIRFRLPIVEWSFGDVMAYLNGEENPLYSQGFDRVGCFPCLASGDKWKEKAFFHDETGRKHYQLVQILGAQIQDNIWTTKGGKAKHEGQDGPGCSWCSI